MKDYLKSIEKKIRENFKIENIEIVDNTHKHTKHKFFDANKFHLSLQIQSKYLTSLEKLKAHKAIMKVLKSDLETKIHALEIKIK